MLDRWRQGLDERHQRMVMAQKHRQMLLQEQMAGLQLRLQSLSPQSVLNRGYSVVSRPDNGAVVQSTAQVVAGDAVDVRVSDGRFRGTVDGILPSEGAKGEGR
jgi:exodeoxyribonuclease VII large subunit